MKTFYTIHMINSETLDFDTTTQEYAHFKWGMPKGWNEGTVTFIPYWTNTGVRNSDRNSLRF